MNFINGIYKISAISSVVKTTFNRNVTNSISMKSPNSDSFLHYSDTLFTDLPEFSKQVNDRFRVALNVIFTRNPKNATSEKTEFLVNKILKDKNYKTEGSLLQYIEALIEYGAKYTPNGELVLNGSDMFKLADYKARYGKKGLSEINSLIECSEKGLISPTALKQKQPGNNSLLFSVDGINPLILGDIEKLKLAKARGIDPIDLFIPQYDNFYSSNVFEKMAPGSLVSFKYGLNGKPEVHLVLGKISSQPLEIDRETLYKLLPPVKRFFIEQSESGTCYQLASYISQMQNPEFLGKLLSRIKVKNGNIEIRMPYGSTSDNLFAGKFPDFDKTGCVLTTLENGRFIAADKSMSVRSNPLFKALEHLYGKHRKYKYAQRYVQQVKENGGNAQLAYQEALKNMDNYVYIEGKNKTLICDTLQNVNNRRLASDKTAKPFLIVEDYYKEVGTVDEVFNFFAHEKYNKNFHCACKTDAQTLSDLRQILLMPKTAKIFGTKYVKTENELQETNLVPQKSLYANHAYSIVGYDKKTDVVQYINPWNSTFVFEMKLPDLAKYINNLSICI